MSLEPVETSTPSFSLALDPYGRLVLDHPDGRRVEGVEPVRAFPLTDPDRWIALLDPAGREALLVPDPAALDPETRRILLDELNRREFLPVIQSIESIAGHSPVSRWTVLTDRGRVQFQVEGDDALRRLGPHRLLVADKDGTRYLIPDTRALPAPIRRKLQALV